VELIIDEHLLLRTYKTEDAENLFHAVNNSRAHLRPWLDWVNKTTRPEHSLRFIQDSLHDIHTQQSMAMGIFHSGNLIGGIGMHKWDQDLKIAQAGYWLTKEYERKGIITQSLIKFIDYLFDHLGLNKIEIRFVVGNKRSAKVAERLNCKVEGIIRQSFMLNGKPEDLVITGLLRNEWKQLKEGEWMIG
jgi:ribosomal-protein-serine acetyltransferase